MCLCKDLGTGNLPIANQLSEELLMTVYQIRLNSSFIFLHLLQIFRLVET